MRSSKGRNSTSGAFLAPILMAIKSILEYTMNIINNIFRYSWLILAAISIFYVKNALVEENVLKNNSVLADLFRDVALSIIVSYVVIILIERNSRIEQNKLIQKYLSLSSQKVLDVIYGSMFPAYVFDDFTSAMIKVHSIYTSARVIIDVRDCGSDKFVCVDITWEYTVKNTSMEDDVFKLNFWKEAKYAGDMLDESIVPSKTRVFVEGVEYSESQIGEMIVPGDEDEEVTYYSKEMKLGPGKSINVKINSGFIRRIEDYYLFRVLKICSSFNAVITKNSNIEIHSDLIHMDGGNISPVETNSCIYWSVDKAMLPNNGIHVYWRKAK